MSIQSVIDVHIDIKDSVKPLIVGKFLKTRKFFGFVPKMDRSYKLTDNNGDGVFVGSIRIPTGYVGSVVSSNGKARLEIDEGSNIAQIFVSPTEYIKITAWQEI